MVTITDEATSPVYTWYLNESVISGATGNSYEVTESGNYKVKIKQTVGCMATSEFLFVVRTQFPDVANIPNVISPNGDGVNDTWVIPQAYVSGSNTEVMLISSQGEVILTTNDYQNDWPINELDFKDTNPVFYYVIKTAEGVTKKGSITVVK